MTETANTQSVPSTALTVPGKGKWYNIDQPLALPCTDGRHRLTDQQKLKSSRHCNGQQALQNVSV